MIDDPRDEIEFDEVIALALAKAADRGQGELGTGGVARWLLVVPAHDSLPHPSGKSAPSWSRGDRRRVFLNPATQTRPASVECSGFSTTRRRTLVSSDLDAGRPDE